MTKRFYVYKLSSKTKDNGWGELATFHKLEYLTSFITEEEAVKFICEKSSYDEYVILPVYITNN